MSGWGPVQGSAAGADEAGLVLVDIDDTIRQVHGYRKQAVAWGYNKVKGLNAIIVTVSTPASVPVVVGIGLRRGSIRSGQNAAWYLARSVSAVRSLAPDGTRTLVRADSAFATHELITAVIGMGGLFLVTVPQWPTVKNAIASVKEEDWTAIRYPRAVWDEACGAWVSDAQVAETRFTAFTSYPEAEQAPVGWWCVASRTSARPPAEEVGAQGELFPVWRYHAFITNTDLSAVAADRTHRRHAIIEQVIAELKDGLLARMRTFLTRIISVPAHLVGHARRTTAHLPVRWPWARIWLRLQHAANDSPESRAA
ncbi:transposase [Actinomyces trachealis]|uniref:transposase n=1 Tax=Actinomyces trachealis TaxID=2763540 RepID=UPI0018C631D2|nr:transposase [Actinomyces trachealis]